MSDDDTSEICHYDTRINTKNYLISLTPTPLRRMSGTHKDNQDPKDLEHQPPITRHTSIVL